MPNPGDVITIPCSAPCCGGSSSSSSGSQSQSSSGGGVDPCSGSPCRSNATYSFTTSGIAISITGCANCTPFNGIWTLTQNNICNNCKWTNGFFKSCSTSDWGWDLAIALSLGVYTYTLTLQRNCGTVKTCSWQGTASDCNGATLIRVAGQCSGTISCTFPATITLSTP